MEGHAGMCWQNGTGGVCGWVLACAAGVIAVKWAVSEIREVVIRLRIT